jgi:hypothetical protein
MFPATSSAHGGCRPGAAGGCRSRRGRADDAGVVRGRLRRGGRTPRPGFRGTARRAPGQVVVHRGHRPGWDDEAEETERAVGGPVEEPLADSAAHAALRSGLSVLGRKPWRSRSRRAKRGQIRSHASRGARAPAISAWTPPMNRRTEALSSTYSSSARPSPASSGAAKVAHEERSVRGCGCTAH